MPQEVSPQLRLSRLNMFLFDFRDAQKFAQYILRRNLHKVKNERAVTKLVHLAFNTSLVVAYSRPFKSNAEIQDGKKVRVRLDATIVHSILSTPQELAFHDKLIKLRDKTFAHSDSSVREIEGFNYDGDTVLFYKAVTEPLTRAETQLLNNMIRKWITNLEQQRSAMKAAKKRIRT
jgi:hypothetical protein